MFFVHTLNRFEDLNISQFGSGKDVMFLLPFHCEWYGMKTEYNRFSSVRPTVALVAAIA